MMDINEFVKQVDRQRKESDPLEEGNTTMHVIIRKYTEKDLPQMIQIWNEVVEDGIAFPQEELLTADTGKHFLQVRPLALSRRILRRESSAVCIFYTPTMLADAVISAMPAMPFAEMRAACILGKSWCRTA